MFNLEEQIAEFPLIVASGLLGYIYFQATLREPEVEYVPPTKEQVEWEYQNVPLFNKTVDSIVSRLRYALQQSNSVDPQPCSDFQDCIGFRETGCHLCEHCIKSGN